MATIVQDVVDLAELIASVASSGPVSAALVLVGTVLIVGSSAVLAYLAAGAALDFVTPESLGRRPPPRG